MAMEFKVKDKDGNVKDFEPTDKTFKDLVNKNDKDGFKKNNNDTGDNDSSPVEEGIGNELMFAEIEVNPNQVEVSIQIVDENIPTIFPHYEHINDAGMDLYAATCVYNEEKDCWIYGTNLRMQPPVGYYLKFAPCSSNRNTNYYMPNSPTTGDRGYTGEYQVSYKNRTAKWVRDAFIIASAALTKVLGGNFRGKLNIPTNTAPYKIGEKIGQMMCVKYDTIVLVERPLVEEDRGENGHGSTHNK